MGGMEERQLQIATKVLEVLLKVCIFVGTLILCLAR
jgi:hypothetical protein